MPYIITDSSFLILISKLEMMDLMANLFNKIEIPQAVFNESVRAGKRFKKIDAVMIEQYIKKQKVKVEIIEDQRRAEKIMHDFNIHNGEAEAIILYQEKDADLLATDDYRALKTCKVLNIKYFTTPLFIQRCYLEKEISKNKALQKFNKLQKLGWYKERIIKYFKKEIEKHGG